MNYVIQCRGGAPVPAPIAPDLSRAGTGTTQPPTAPFLDSPTPHTPPHTPHPPHPTPHTPHPNFAHTPHPTPHTLISPTPHTPYPTP
ncbi:MAG: hypothetical protein F6J93_11355 [Oscillatoria sp. SIO1A7]|nr:hypothetical protein [Oscillatoria sp. SIO1A7]